MRILFALALVVLATAAKFQQPIESGRIGDLGFMLGIQEECSDFFCQEAHLSILNYTFPPPALHKGEILVNFTIDYPGGTTMFIGRFSTYDFDTNTFYVLTQMDGVSDYIYQLYTINLKATPPTVKMVEMPDVSKMDLVAIAWDSVYKRLQAIFDVNMYLLDASTGKLTLVGPLTDTPEIEPTLTTAYDSNTHQFFIAVSDLIEGTNKLLTYNTKTNTSFMTPSYNNNDHWVLYQMEYYAKNDSIIALCWEDPRYGWPSIKTFDYRTGRHVDFFPEWIWHDYCPEYSLYPLSAITSGTVALDPVMNLFFLTVKYLTPSSYAEDQTLLYYNLTKLNLEMSSGPMVIYENALAFTNYVWYNWDMPF